MGLPTQSTTLMGRVRLRLLRHKLYKTQFGPFHSSISVSIKIDFYKHKKHNFFFLRFFWDGKILSTEIKISL